jgi:predicted RNA methylase
MPIRDPRDPVPGMWARVIAENHHGNPVFARIHRRIGMILEVDARYNDDGMIDLVIVQMLDTQEVEELFVGYIEVFLPMEVYAET